MDYEDTKSSKIHQLHSLLENLRIPELDRKNPADQALPRGAKLGKKHGLHLYQQGDRMERVRKGDDVLPALLGLHKDHIILCVDGVDHELLQRGLVRLGEHLRGLPEFISVHALQDRGVSAHLLLLLSEDELGPAGSRRGAAQLSAVQSSH
eukprot:CAMPEP_0168335382 /NCGR_PEP_ID=MMETSP0213-20121227/10880_1 /TAXON_ID=151035 /ORGANISM="Euplotes harpa, Strain FSP1.4" /LENGTH=150 /DNA_ID=CAMNT_0008340307 /DNA_START=644 /DNA_END=1096 /DNA_ORIENTATION=+